VTASVIFNDAAFDAMVNDIAGPIGRFLVAVTEESVLPEAVDALSVPAIRFGSNKLATSRSAIAVGTLERASAQWSSVSSDIIRNTWAPNPPPGPPMRRTGDLIDSLEAVGPLIDEGGIVAYGVAFVSHGGFGYPIELRDRGYKFFPLDDPRFVYIDQ